MWSGVVANIILGTKPNDSLVYAPEMELHHPNMSTLGGHRVPLDSERDHIGAEVSSA